MPDDDLAALNLLESHRDSSSVIATAKRELDPLIPDHAVIRAAPRMMNNRRRVNCISGQTTSRPAARPRGRRNTRADGPMCPSAPSSSYVPPTNFLADNEPAIVTTQTFPCGGCVRSIVQGDEPLELAG
jgi:hypothetical protein